MAEPDILDIPDHFPNPGDFSTDEWKAKRKRGMAKVLSMSILFQENEFEGIVRMLFDYVHWRKDKESRPEFQWSTVKVTLPNEAQIDYAVPLEFKQICEGAGIDEEHTAWAWTYLQYYFPILAQASDYKWLTGDEVTTFCLW